MKRGAFLIILFLPFCSLATQISVRVMADYNISSVILSPLAGQYKIFIDGKEVPNTDIFQVTYENDSLQVKTFENTLGKCAAIRLIALNDISSFKLKPVIPSSRVRNYDDNLEITASGGFLKIINYVDLEHYLAGVVEAEAGHGSDPQFYQVQAILCRTYALSHLRRHEAENYHLCDRVHCQAYKSKGTSHIISEAVFDTRGLVVVDTSFSLITAAYHSNCGGQTMNSEDVWTLAVPYLRSVKDTFCLKMPHARWTRKIPAEDWKIYLSLKKKYAGDDSLNNFELSPFQSRVRSVNYSESGLKIPLKTIREDWKLRSTYFTIDEQDGNINFSGKGYGHGVGLCQEGAMKMADKKYNYTAILNYYYRNIRIVELGTLDFFREGE